MNQEKELLAGARAFDPDVLAAVYDRYSSGIYRYAMRLLGDDCLAEDCVAETFHRFLLALKNGGGPQDHLQAYLYRIAHNWITDCYRSQPPPPLMLDEGLRSSEAENPAAGDVVERQRVRAALVRLTDEQREVVVLKFVEGWENEEIAHQVEKPVSAVKALQHRALEALRRLLVWEEGAG